MRKTRLSLFIVLLACVTNGFSQERTVPTPISAEGHLRQFLQAHFRDLQAGEDKTTTYAATFVDLRDNGQEDAIVYVDGRLWCGSGGCNTLILVPAGRSYRVVTTIMITRPPIRVLDSKTNGWHDIAVRVQGGGDVIAYDAKLTFNGKSYPISPASRRAERLPKGAPGKVVISEDAKETPLY